MHPYTDDTVKISKEETIVPETRNGKNISPNRRSLPVYK
jgi:hypothetical protein